MYVSLGFTVYNNHPFPHASLSELVIVDHKSQTTTLEIKQKLEVNLTQNVLPQSQDLYHLHTV